MKTINQYILESQKFLVKGHVKKQDDIHFISHIYKKLDKLINAAYKNKVEYNKRGVTAHAKGLCKDTYEYYVQKSTDYPKIEEILELGKKIEKEKISGVNVTFFKEHITIYFNLDIKVPIYQLSDVGITKYEYYKDENN